MQVYPLKIQRQNQKPDKTEEFRIDLFFRNFFIFLLTIRIHYIIVLVR